MPAIIEFNSTDDLPLRVVQKLNHNFKSINNGDAGSTVVRIIEDTVTYDSLGDKPSINDVTIVGDLSLGDLGICPVDENGRVPTEFLPGYVDDVIECRTDPEEQPYSVNWLINLETSETIAPETGKVYLVVNGDSTAIYRWSGTVYVQVSAVIDDYRQLSNKPSIEGVELVGDKDMPALGIFIDPDNPTAASDDYALTNTELDALWSNTFAS